MHARKKYKVIKNIYQTVLSDIDTSIDSMRRVKLLFAITRTRVLFEVLMCLKKKK